MLTGVNSSHYRKQPPGHAMRIHLNIDNRCEMFLEIKKCMCKNACYLHVVVFSFQTQDTCQM